ncbi:hypothetical protein KP509_08G054300 [Ceratopteris richardii]|uniref:Uncharacterized protein n=1 Tax=Ceratopteris richardii TaxID=49495 RepID=A0A8T2UCB2_CERRI|nr:hypothetical protein KP509_08G054300 [Ceratopteris richardii]
MAIEREFEAHRLRIERKGSSQQRCRVTWRRELENLCICWCCRESTIRQREKERFYSLNNAKLDLRGCKVNWMQWASMFWIFPKLLRLVSRALISRILTPRKGVFLR